MKKNVNLLEDNIFYALSRMALPLMGTSFIQMAYSLVDVMWLGRVSTEAVAAAGACSYFMWLSNSLALIAKTGLSVTLSQAYGRDDNLEAKKSMKSGMIVNIIVCIMSTMILLLFRQNIIGFYKLDTTVHNMAIDYLTIVSIGLIFLFSNPILAVTFYSEGNSVTPFKISVIALLFNMIVDPILIFGIGPFPKMGVSGAALATVLAQMLGTILFVLVGIKSRSIFTRVNYFSKYNKKNIIEILKIGVPASLQSSIHATVGVVLNKYISSFGPKPIAVYSVGAQIESITWMTSEGFSNAVAAFMGQNYGAKNFERIKNGYKSAMKIFCSIGLFTTIVLFFGNEALFKLFLPNDLEAIKLGGDYLKIIAFSQLAMSVEIGTSGALNGLGLTRYPAIIGAVFNIGRIPMSELLIPLLAVNGIWMSMSISSNFKGIFVLLTFIFLYRRTKGFRENMEKYSSKN